MLNSLEILKVNKLFIYLILLVCGPIDTHNIYVHTHLLTHRAIKSIETNLNVIQRIKEFYDNERT